MKNILHIDTITAIMPTFIRLPLERVRHSPLGYRLAKGALWSLCGTAISRGMMLASLIIVARMLGKEGFGEFGIIKSTVGMLGVFAGFGLGLTANKHIAEFRDKDNEKAGRILSLSGFVAVFTGVIMGLLLVLFGPWLAKNTLAAPHLGGLLKIAALILFFEAINGAQTGALAGFEAFKAIARVNFVVGIITFPLMVGGVYFAGLKGAVWALVVTRILNWLLNHLALRQEAAQASVPFNISACLREYPILFAFSFPAFLSSAMVGPVRWGVSALLVNQPNGYGEMGIFNAAYSFQQFLLFLAMTLGHPLLPMITNELETKNEKLEKVNILSTWSLGVFAALPLLAFPEFIQAFFGKEFDLVTFSKTFVLVILATSIMIYKQGLARVLQANGLMWWALSSNLVWAILLLVSAFFLVPMGSVGIAFAILVSYMLNTIIFVPLYTRRKLVPKATIISSGSMIIWIVLIVFAILSWLGISIIIRLVSLPAGLIIIFLAFKNLMTPTANSKAMKK